MVAFLPDGDRELFVDEVVRTAKGAADSGSIVALAQVLIAWKSMAAIHADPDASPRSPLDSVAHRRDVP